MKKIFCIIASILVMTSALCVSAAEMNSAQAERLNSLGIMNGDPDGSLRLNDSITRAEAAKMLCIAKTTQDFIDSSEITDSFNDVPESHWAYRYICYAKKNGIANGDENGNFNPEANITNAEITKMVVSLLGYSVFADINGGYPAGYMMAATRFGITDGLTLITDSSAIRSDVGIMINNALDTPLMVNTSENGDEEFSIMDGNNGEPRKTLLTERNMK